MNDDETFSWTPVASLNDPEIRNPFASPTVTTKYTVKVNPGAVGCDGYDSITVRILPDHITVLNNDSVVCAGSQVPYVPMLIPISVLTGHRKRILLIRQQPILY